MHRPAQSGVPPDGLGERRSPSASRPPSPRATVRNHERRFLGQLVEETADRQLFRPRHVLLPVVAGLGHDRHDVLDFFLDSIGRRRRQLEVGAVGLHGDVLDDDRPQQPAGHRLALTGQAHPARCRSRFRVEAAHHLDAATDLLDDRGISIRLRLDVGRRRRFQKASLVRRPARHRQIAEGVPHLVPGHPAVRVEAQSCRPHRDRLHVFVGVAIVLGQDDSEPVFQRTGGHSPPS